MLLDECLPKRLTRELPGHVVRTVPQMGWSGRKNGLLLRTMAAQGFEAFVTMDKNLPFQQNLADLPIVLIILFAASNRYPQISPLVPGLVSALTRASRGDVIRPGEPPLPQNAA